MQSCMQKNEKKHEKWDCGSQVSLGVFCLLLGLKFEIKQNRCKIHSIKNVVCCRKDKAAGTQFLPCPVICEL